MSAKFLFQLGALFTVIIPVGIVFFRWNLLKKVPRALGLFLILGLLVDLKYFLDIPQVYKDVLLGIYVLSEVLFYTWVLSRVAPNFPLRKYRWTLYLSVILLWTVSYWRVILMLELSIANSIFDVITSLLLSCCAAYQLFMMTRSEIPLARRGATWFLFGIFVYFMCSSFLFSFIAVDFREKIWFIHSIFDIMKMILFSIGFVVAAREAKYIASSISK